MRFPVGSSCFSLLAATLVKRKQGENWPEYDSLPGLDGVKRWTRYERQIGKKFHGWVISSLSLFSPWITDELASTGSDTVDLLDKLLILDPSRRITAAAALDHDWFWTDPMPADPKTCAFLMNQLYYSY